MELDFVKLHGLGNDFVFIDDFSREIELSAEQVAHICDRHFGVGADGVILVRPSDRSECAAYMHYINADGSLAQMCGNGVRCFAKYLVDRGYVQASSGMFVADTLSGPRPISFRVDETDALIDATVDMGHPILDPSSVPVALPVNATGYDGVGYVHDALLPSPWGDFAFTCVSMGNPHAICFVDDFSKLPDELFPNPEHKSLDTFDIDRIGAFYESNPVFPEKANIEFASISSRGFCMRVFERGVGETLACGTGTCATNVAAALTGRAGRENDIHLLGGTLHILWDDNDHVMMTGPAEESFEGTFEIV